MSAAMDLIRSPAARAFSSESKMIIVSPLLLSSDHVQWPVLKPGELETPGTTRPLSASRARSASWMVTRTTSACIWASFRAVSTRGTLLPGGPARPSSLPLSSRRFRGLLRELVHPRSRALRARHQQVVVDALEHRHARSAELGDVARRDTRPERPGDPRVAE